MIDYYQVFLIIMTDVALFFYIQHSGGDTLFILKYKKKEGINLPFIIHYVHVNI
ncbi:hypothetical protein [Bacillus sp. SRB_331]|uniref:hypothetical protein n=1 Tax=Bacillus sp. SRB_331 TaxID=1969379 RepID=UPI0021AC7A1A|nr:hypothetical protein [Bacillus sp. SRB_331]